MEEECILEAFKLIEKRRQQIVVVSSHNKSSLHWGSVPWREGSINIKVD